MIRWSPEVIRDPTFWFLFTLSSLSLVAGRERSAHRGCSSPLGMTIALAAATRLEGLLLVIPLVMWSAARWRALARDGDRAADGHADWRLASWRCLGVLPAVAMLALIVAGLRGHAVTELFRIRPFILAGGGRGRWWRRCWAMRPPPAACRRNRWMADLPRRNVAKSTSPRW